MLGHLVVGFLLILQVQVPTDAKIKVGGLNKENVVEGYAEISLVGIPKDAGVIWRITPQPVKKSIIGDVLVFAGVAGRKYEVEAMVISWADKKVSQVFQEVTFAGIPIPPPDNPPGPDPKPEDPLVKTFKMAIASDSDKALISKFLDLYDDMLKDGGTIDSSVTYGDWEKKTAIKAAQLGIAGKAKTFQTAVAEYAKTQLPWEGVSGDPINRALVKKTYHHIRICLDLALRSTK